MKKALVCMGLGAGIMYLFDPKEGEQRRAQLFDTLSGLLPKTSDAIHHKADAIVAKVDDVTAQADTAAAEAITNLGPQVEEGASGSADSEQGDKQE